MAVSYGVGYICSSDPALLRLWCRPVATTLIRPLAWESPYATGAALEMEKKKKKDNYVFCNLIMSTPNLRHTLEFA